MNTKSTLNREQVAAMAAASTPTGESPLASALAGFKVATPSKSVVKPPAAMAVVSSQDESELTGMVVEQAGGASNPAEVTPGGVADLTVDESTVDVALVATTDSTERRGPAHAHARELVIEAQAQPTFTLATSKVTTPKSAPKPELEVSWLNPEEFLTFDPAHVVALVQLEKARGYHPMVAIEIDVPGAYTRVDFSLAIVPTDRVQMMVRGGDGFFFGLFGLRQRFFRDEVFSKALPEGHQRKHVTVGLQSLIALRRSLLDATIGRR